VLDRYGITHAFVLPHAGLVHAGKVASDNDDVAIACKGSGGRMIPFCAVHPFYEEEALRELERCLGRLGFRGIKFHPWLQGISPSSPATDAVCELAGQHKAPVLFHDGTPPFALPSQIALLARRHPRTQFVLGHMGLFEHWREAIAAMNHAENLWGCLCSPHVAALRQIVNRCDKDRLMWGSDHGFTLDDPIGYRLGLMESLGLSDDDRDAILHRNPSRLIPGKPDAE
jgi:predicted TIM-barrel fold metal-dependent hydrolase